MIIRPERESDIDAIRDITDAAFAEVPQSRQTESAIVEALRAAGALTLSLVAVDGDRPDGQIVGHLAVSPVTVDGDARRGWYGGGPLSVRPDRQRQGVGSALVRAAFSELRARGARGCVLVGDPRYYRRFGFASTGELAVADVPAENVLALALEGPIPHGTVVFHPAFAAEREPHE
ncbi:GNAT family N-acetyltransferase [Mycolicibacterium palauense]|uniref:GNAT family N-acetyltransferase n=1 Tax=Mycolicibacterium palauense TaxID=2034511 RepID=UPI000BFED80F|nr:N-acetyltransferase [Mycolicibacterium palauense]